MDKYRYHIYPDRTYVFQLDDSDFSDKRIEMKGSEIIELLGIGSYYEPFEDTPESTEL
jgi:hypothetical protein